MTDSEKKVLIEKAEPYIREGWTVSQLTTVQECDDARNIVTNAMACIEDQILRAKQDAVVNRKYADPDWYARIQFALRKQKQVMVMIQNRRGYLSKTERHVQSITNDRKLLDAIKEMNPRVFYEAVKRVFPDARVDAEVSA